MRHQKTQPQAITLVAGIIVTASERFAVGSQAAIGGALLASMNTASEYGFGAVIASLPGFLVVADALRAIPDPRKPWPRNFGAWRRA